MVSVKGLLFTTLGAAAAATLVGIMLTPGRGSEKLRNAGNTLNRWVDKTKSLTANLTKGASRERAEFSQASGMGHP